MQISPVKSNSKGTKTNKSDILIKPLQEGIYIFKKELTNKEDTIKDLSIILWNITYNTYKVSPSNKESGNESTLEYNADHTDLESSHN